MRRYRDPNLPVPTRSCAHVLPRGLGNPGPSTRPKRFATRDRTAVRVPMPSAWLSRSGRRQGIPVSSRTVHADLSSCAAMNLDVTNWQRTATPVGGTVTGGYIDRVTGRTGPASICARGHIGHASTEHVVRDGWVRSRWARACKRQVVTHGAGGQLDPCGSEPFHVLPLTGSHPAAVRGRRTVPTAGHRGRSWFDAGLPLDRLVHRGTRAIAGALKSRIGSRVGGEASAQSESDQRGSSGERAHPASVVDLESGHAPCSCSGSIVVSALQARNLR